MQLATRWDAPVTCTQEEFICDIAYKKSTLALIVRNAKKQSIRMELRSLAMLDRLWSLEFDVKNNQNKAMCCCSFISDEWLVADHITSRLIYITNDGKVKSKDTYNAKPWCATLFGSNMLAISTSTGVNLHKL